MHIHLLNVSVCRYIRKFVGTSLTKISCGIPVVIPHSCTTGNTTGKYNKIILWFFCPLPQDLTKISCGIPVVIPHSCTTGNTIENTTGKYHRKIPQENTTGKYHKIILWVFCPLPQDYHRTIPHSNYHTGVPHSKTTHQSVPHKITTAIPHISHVSTTQQYHTTVPHSSNTTQQYHTALPHNSAT